MRKSFFIRENIRFVLVGEAFNSLNVPQYGAPVSNLRDPRFGQLINEGGGLAPILPGHTELVLFRSAGESISNRLETRAAQAPVSVNAGARLDRLPISRFHYRMLGLIGSGLFLDSLDLYIQGPILAFLLSTKFSDINGNAQFLSATFLGLIVGTLISGSCGDRSAGG